MLLWSTKFQLFKINFWNNSFACLTYQIKMYYAPFKSPLWSSSTKLLNPNAVFTCRSFNSRWSVLQVTTKWPVASSTSEWPVSVRNKFLSFSCFRIASHFSLLALTASCFVLRRIFNSFLLQKILNFLLSLF